MQKSSTERLSEQELSRLSPEARHVFASRCALRVMPVVGQMGHLGFWKGNAAYYVGAIEIAASSAFLKSRGVKSEVLFKARNASSSSASSASSVADAFAFAFAAFAFAASSSASSAAAADAAADAADASSSSAASSAAFSADASASAAARADYEYLLREDNPHGLFDEPLWMRGVPKGWEKIIKAWEQALKGINLINVAQRYKSLYGKGTPVYSDYEEATEKWYADHQKRRGEPVVESIARERINYWWVNANPAIWKISDSPVGLEQAYMCYTEETKGWSKMKENFPEVVPGDLMVGYESSPTQKVVAVLEAMKGVDKSLPEKERSITFAIKGFFRNPIPWKDIKAKEELQGAAPVKDNYASLHRLSKEEFDVVYSMGGGIRLEAEEKKVPPERMEEADHGNIITLLPDGAAVEDRLGREPLVFALRDLLDFEAQKGQLTIGLMGHWGIGKTSVLDMLKLHLSMDKDSRKEVEPKNTFIFGEFNAWSYEHTDNIQAGLAQEVVNSVTKDYCWLQRLVLAIDFSCRFHPLRTILITFILECAFFVFLAELGCQNLITNLFADELSKNIVKVTGVGGLLGFFYWLAKQSKELFAHPLAASFKTYFRLPHFGKHLGELPIIQRQVKQLLEIVLFPRFRKEKRMVFVVDDLDRCGVDGIVKTLEAVRLVMDLPNVVVIVAIDHRMALAALTNKYYDLAEKGGDRSARDIARDYLGKIFQIPIQLQEPHGEIKGYIDADLFHAGEKEALLKEDNPYKGDLEKAGTKGTRDDGTSEQSKTDNSGEGEASQSQSATGGEGGVSEGGEDEKESADKVEQGKEKPEIIVAELKNTTLENEVFRELAEGFTMGNPRSLKPGLIYSLT